MECVLIVAVLTIQSSYAQNEEWELEGNGVVPDTVQMWIGPKKAWRIRTFAADHDIHVYSVERRDKSIDEVFERSTRNNYGEVLASFHRFKFERCDFGEAELISLKNAGLAPILETSEMGFIFWKPDNAEYVTRSQPRD